MTTMAMNPIQFQPGLSLTGFLDQYGTQAACARALRGFYPVFADS